MSSRAITANDLRRMWLFNQRLLVKVQLDNKELVGNEYTGRSLVHDGHTYMWGGLRCRKMMQAIYTLAFICLLRFEEVLKIQAHHITVVDERKGVIKVDLYFRKTNQFGGKLVDDEGVVEKLITNE
jgi:hypothetical protein